jgi:hypothetical protein
MELGSDSYLLPIQDVRFSYFLNVTVSCLKVSGFRSQSVNYFFSSLQANYELTNAF